MADHFSRDERLNNKKGWKIEIAVNVYINSKLVCEIEGGLYNLEWWFTNL